MKPSDLSKFLSLAWAALRTAQGAPGPGTFHVHLYDALAQMTEEVLRAAARIEVAG